MRLDGGVDHALDVDGVGDVGVDERGDTALVADQPDGLPAGVVGPVDDGHGGALPGEQEAAGPAHPRSAPGDEGDLALQSVHQSSNIRVTSSVSR